MQKQQYSQDICFVPNGDYAAFIEDYTGKKYPEGDFVDTSGNVLGKHKGIIRYMFAYIPNNLLFVNHKERIVIHIAQRVVEFNILFMGTHPEVAGEIRMNGTTCLLPFNPHGGSENSK